MRIGHIGSFDWTGRERKGLDMLLAFIRGPGVLRRVLNVEGSSHNGFAVGLGEETLVAGNFENVSLGFALYGQEDEPRIREILDAIDKAASKP